MKHDAIVDGEAMPAVEGNDVTHLIGVPVDDVAYEVAFREFQAAHQLAADKPCVRNWRAAVLACDRLQSVAAGRTLADVMEQARV